MESTKTERITRQRANLVLATLFLGTFVLGNAELLVVGVLNLIATDLHVSVPSAGALVTAYALGLAVGGPVLTALTIRLNRRTVLIGAVVPPERTGRAISVVISGFAVSAALGVPLGTLVGQALGWRGSFLAIVALSVLALVASLVLVPSVPSTGGGAGSQARYAFAPRYWPCCS